VWCSLSEIYRNFLLQSFKEAIQTSTKNTMISELVINTSNIKLEESPANVLAPKREDSLFKMQQDISIPRSKAKKSPRDEAKSPRGKAKKSP
jgi:hypothetical protein